MTVVHDLCPINYVTRRVKDCAWQCGQHTHCSLCSMPLVYMRLSLRSLQLEWMWCVIAQWACRLFICLSLVRLSLSVSTRSTMSRALFSHLPVLHCKVCGIFYVLRFGFSIQKSVLHFSVTLAMYSNVGSMQFTMSITNVTDKVQIVVIAVLLILLCVCICVEKLKHHRYVVNTT